MLRLRHGPMEPAIDPVEAPTQELPPTPAGWPAGRLPHIAPRPKGGAAGPAAGESGVSAARSSEQQAWNGGTSTAALPATDGVTARDVPERPMLAPGVRLSGLMGE